MERYPDVSLVGAAYTPLSTDLNLGLYAPSLRRQDQAVAPVQLEDLYDYTRPEIGWYADALHTGPGWREPQSEAAVESLVSASGCRQP